MEHPITAVTRDFPDGSLAFANPTIEPRAYTGFDVGPFFAHFATSDDGRQTCAGEADPGCWHVTHRASGFAVQKSLTTHARGIWLAKKLAEFGSWDGSTREEVLGALSDDDRAAINVLRADAVSGDCQGDMA